jgi:hypothetical protein
MQRLHAQGGDARTIAQEMKERKAQVFQKRPYRQPSPAARIAGRLS